MMQRLTQGIFDAWTRIKIKLKIPLPLKNHFYKGHRISIKRNWFCGDCSFIFSLRPWHKLKREPAGNQRCPACGSKSIVWTTLLFMAIVDKKPKDYLQRLLKLSTEEIINWIAKNKTL